MKKVYCCNCKYFDARNNYDTFHYLCGNENTMKTKKIPGDPIYPPQEEENYSICIKVNKNNDCKYYEQVIKK